MINKIKNKKFTVIVPATISNLGPGFDCLGCALSLYNKFSFNFNLINSITVKSSIKGIQSKIPLNKNNLCLRALNFTLNYFNCPHQKVSIKINNAIPVERGLGSSATAILAGITAGFVYLNKKIDYKEVLDIAFNFEPHPDNLSTALYGGLVLSIPQITGKEYLYKRHKVSSKIRIGLIVPDLKINTQKAREILPKKIGYNNAIFNLSRLPVLMDILRTGRNMNLLKQAMSDKYHQPFRAKLMPWLNDVINEAYNNSAAGCCLSGSGPTLIVISNKYKSQLKIKKSILNLLRKKGITAKYFCPEIDYSGLHFIKE